MATETIKTKTVIDTFDYRLYLGPNIKNPSKPVLEIPPLHARQNTYVVMDDKKFSIVLSGLKFTRKVYAPGLIEAEITIIPVENDKKELKELSFGDLEGMFENRQVELTIVDTSKKTDNEEVIAKNYYVYLINPQIVPSNNVMNMFVKLTIHSFDKLMTIDKYCKAFTTKKLSSGILMKEYSGFGLTDDMMLADIKNLKNLTYVSDGNTVEKIQPYLVQYNESFYDFMVRTANRCGEFFYFEDGKLTLGLPNKTTEKLDSFISVTMQGYTSGPISVDDYSRDSVKSSNTVPEDALNFDPVEKDDAGYPKDTFLENLKFNDPLAGDEFIFPLDNDKYSSIARDLCLRGVGEIATTALLKASDEVVKSEDGCVTTIVGDILGGEAKDAYTWGITDAWSSNDREKNLSETWGSKPEHYNNKTLVSFSSLDPSGWIGNSFYSKIRHQEEKQHKMIICIDMGTNYTPVKLGDTIQVKGLTGNYIVIQVNLIANMVWQRNYRKFDPNDPSTDKYSDRQSQVIYAIPFDESNAVPPVAPVPMFRKSGPQTAFVVDNADPKYQGRVRIAYPWQSPIDNLRQEMYVSKESLTKAYRDLDNAKKKLAEIEALLNTKKNVQELFEELKGLSGDDLKNRIEELKQKQTDNLAVMKTLESAMVDPITLVKKQNLTPEDYKALLDKREQYLKLKQENDKIEEALKLLDKDNPDIDQAINKLNEEVTKATEEKKKANDNIKDLTKKKGEKEEALKKDAEKWNKELSGMATPWVRIATPLATEGGGAFFKPNKGDEVLVNFDSENIERPYVVGSVFSKNTLAPGEGLDKLTKNYLQKNAQIALMSTNGQHISFTAPNDGWKFMQGFSPMLKTLQTYIAPLKPKIKDWGDFKDLNGGIYMGDRFGMYELSLSSHDRKIKISSPYGNVEIGAFSGITINAPNGDIKIKGKNVSIEAGNKLTFHSGKNIREPQKSSVMGAVKSAAKEALAPVANIMKIVDFTLLRSVIEVFLRPIDGTLCIKSNNYVMLEAGKGKAQIPLERYTKYYRKKYQVDEEMEKKAVYAKIIAYIQRIDGKGTRFQNDYMELKEAAFQKKDVIDKILKAIWTAQNKPDLVKRAFKLADGKFAPASEDLTKGTLSKEIKDFKYGNIKPLPANGWKVPFSAPIKGYNKLRQDYIRKYVDEYGQAITLLQQKSRQIVTMFDDYTIKAVNQSLFGTDSDDETKWIDDLFKSCTYGAAENMMKKELDKWENRYGKKGNDPTDSFMKDGDLKDMADPFANLSIMKRKLIATFLAILSAHDKNKKESAVPGMPGEAGKYIKMPYQENDVNDDFVTNSWDKIAHIGDYEKDKEKEMGMIASIVTDALSLNSTRDQFDDILNIKEANKVWNSQSGQILYSSSPGATYAFKGDTIETFDVSNQNKNKAALKKAIAQITIK